MRTPNDMHVSELVKHVKDFAANTGHHSVVLADVDDKLHIATTQVDMEHAINLVGTCLVNMIQRLDEPDIVIYVATTLLHSANITMNDNDVTAMRNTLARLQKEEIEKNLPKPNLRLI